MVLTGQEREEASILEFQKQYESKFPKGFYLLEIGIQNLSDYSEHDILLFCINNIFCEILEDTLIGVPVEMWDKVYFLVKKDETDISKRLSGGIEFIKNRLSISICLGISSLKSNFLDIREAKWEADCMAEYAKLAGIFYLPLQYSEIMKQDAYKKDKLSYALKKIINLVLAEDYEGCRELLKSIYEEQDTQEYSNIRESYQQIMVVLSVISIPYQEKTGKINEADLQNKGIRELYQISIEMLNALIGETKAEIPGSRLFEQMVKYIQEHITDPSLNAGELCERFDITPSYISKIFKKETGEGVLDYIHHERIRQAKELLKSGKTVQEVALSMGYTDARGFIRAFKRYEGITPGQYKNM